MLVVEVLENPNCAAVDARLFHELAPPQMVRRVRLERQAGDARWYGVTGWTRPGAPCPAMIHKVDDSGDGVAFLISGGDAGLRLKPAGHLAPWRLDDAAQWGEPFLLVSDLGDVEVAPPAECHRTIVRSRAHG